jgi:hypothetical protein
MREADRLAGECKSLRQKIAHLEHTCACVVLNSDVGVWDIAGQQVARRNSLGVGLVSETLSASKDCLRCGGTGIPKDQTSRQNDQENQLRRQP